MTTPGNEALERILTAPNEIARHAEIRSQLDAAGIDRPRDGQFPLPAAIDAASTGASDHWRAIGRAASVCRCDPHRAVVEIQAQGDGSATVSCPKCLAQFTMPPLVAGGQDRTGDEVRRHAWTVALLIALAAIVLAAAMIGGAL